MFIKIPAGRAFHITRFICIFIISLVLLIISSCNSGDNRNLNSKTQDDNTPLSPTSEAIKTNVLSNPTLAATSIARVADTATEEAKGLQVLYDRFGMEFVYVSEGNFTMGSTQTDVDDAVALCNQQMKQIQICTQKDVEAQMPQHQVYVNGFWIGKTEVTIGQYRAFMESEYDGYDQRNLWTKEGWTWRGYASINGIGQPGCVDDWERLTKSTQPEYPLNCVVWYEAVAYVRWLSQKTGILVRLPTEAEWEKAARGLDGRHWPWGEDTPNATYLNYCDRNCSMPWADINSDDNYVLTAPVGLFPIGASPYGVLDMAGNVWELTSTLWGGCGEKPSFLYPYQMNDGRENLESTDCRVIRGGSASLPSVAARTTVRSPDTGANLLQETGLRLVIGLDGIGEEWINFVNISGK